MSITKIISNLEPAVEKVIREAPDIIKTVEKDIKLIEPELKAIYKLIKTLAQQITAMKDPIFGNVAPTDLVAKNLSEYAALKATRQATMQNDLDQAKAIHASIFSTTKTALKSKK